VAEPALRKATFIGQITQVRGGLLTVRLRPTPTTLLMVEGAAYRVGQIGAFLRVPLGYTDLYGVCVQVGADSLGPADEEDPFLLQPTDDPKLEGYRWIQVALFGESSEGRFQRGVGQFPTVGDEVHIVTARDLDVIYADRGDPKDAVVVGRIADSEGIPAALEVSSLVTRHASIVGSTGAGKSNLVAVLLRALAGGDYRSARVLVVDPHGEYGTAVPEHTRVVSGNPENEENRLRVPYWALNFDELIAITMGALRDPDAEFLRDKVRELKREAAEHLPRKPPPQAITADSPIPFSLKRFWWELQHEEVKTYKEANKQTPETIEDVIDEGDMETLRPTRYPPPSGKATRPFRSKNARGIGRQLELLRSRMLDGRFDFMFREDAWSPDREGKVELDLDALLQTWIGSDRPLTVIDVSDIPASVLEVVVGTVLGIVYDALYWGMALPVGGKEQPLLIVLDEAHRFLREGSDTAATRVCSRIAKEGRKYGAGLLSVTQRPSDIDPGVVSQAGTMIALRVTNAADRAAVRSTAPDDLTGLTDLLPVLRTGEALVLGEAMHIPSRVRITKAPDRPVGEDPVLPDRWLVERPDQTGYEEVLVRWRAQTTSSPAQDPGGGIDAPPETSTETVTDKRQDHEKEG
jgi:uncharacterized protein